MSAQDVPPAEVQEKAGGVVTHYFGDDCPGGHGAARPMGADPDDQLAPQEANQLEARVRDIVRLANRRGYVEDRIVSEILALFAEERAK